MINQNMLDGIRDDWDSVPSSELPNDTDFAMEIVKRLPVEQAMEAITAYTHYYSCRVHGLIKEPDGE